MNQRTRSMTKNFLSKKTSKMDPKIKKRLKDLL